MLKSRTPLADAIAAAQPALRATFGLSLFINLTLFAVPLYSLQVFDRVLASRNLGTLAVLTVIVGIFILLYGLLEYVRSGVLIRGGVRFNETLSKPAYELAMRAQLAGRPAAGAQALKDADTLREALSGSTVSTLFDVPWTPVFVAICFIFHPAMGFVALAGAILIFTCALLTEMATRDRLAEAGKHAAEAQRFSAGSLRNAETVRGLGMGAAVLARWVSIQNAALLAQVSSSEKAALLTAATKVVRLSVQIALIGTGAWLAIDRLISPGVMMAAMIIMGRALAPVEHAVANWKRIVAARAARSRLEALFSSLPAAEKATALPKAQGALSVEGVSLKTPKGSQLVLKDVSFSLEPGSSLAIIGPSGGGKSSLAKALAGIWHPAIGAVRLDAAALSQWEPAQLGQHIGYLPQEIEFFAGTIAENIARLAVPDDAQVIAAARAAGVHETILKQPKGYQTELGDGEVVLSGGMRQRLALARALYANPCLVIMDEPNSNLDSEGEAALAKAIANMKVEGRTVVVVTHRPQLLAHIDRVLVLAAGRVQAFGSRDEVLGKRNGTKIAALPLHPSRNVKLDVEHTTPNGAIAPAA